MADKAKQPHGKEIDPDVVETFLETNPTYIEKWLKLHATDALITKIKPVTSKPIHSKIEAPKFMNVAKNVVTNKLLKTYLEGSETKKEIKVMETSDLKNMREEEVFMQLVRDIASELNVDVLCHKILRNVSLLTKSDRGSLFLSRGTTDNKFLVSKLFDVTKFSVLEDCLHDEEKAIKVPYGRGIAGHVAQSKQFINIPEAYDDPRFNQDVDKKTGYRTHSILCMPILTADGDVIGVAQIINKRDSDDHAFSTEDIKIFEKYLIFCGIGITNAQLFEMSVKEYQRNQLLLTLARGVFEEQHSLERLCQKIMTEAQSIVNCERCSIYLLKDFCEAKIDDNGETSKDTKLGTYTTPNEVVFSKAFDLFYTDPGNLMILSKADIDKSKNADLGKGVAINKKLVNVIDLEMDSRYGKAYFVDESGFKTKSLVCMPIVDNKCRVIGVTQLINKRNQQSFSENDENIMEAFSIFTGLGIHNCQMYESVSRLMAKQRVALEVLSYHAMAPAEELKMLTNAEIKGPECYDVGLYSFDFDDYFMSDDETLFATICMFNEIGVVEKFNVNYEVLCRWTCSVKKNYRNVTYHNWRHAFNVAQTMFTIFFSGGLCEYLQDLEMFALIAACLCHDLDHRGTNNTFQVKVDSPLAALYSTSVMEHHHFDHCIMILNSEGNNIFDSLSAENYRLVIKTLEHAIISTDLALYFGKRGNFKALIEKGEKNFHTGPNKEILKAMMMTACDVAAICKPWEIQFRTADLVSAEFFEQGDVEKEELGEMPIAMMDRDKKSELPKMQIGFIDAICTPVYDLFSQLSPKMKHLYNGVIDNRANWNRLAEIGMDRVDDLSDEINEGKMGNLRSTPQKVTSKLSEGLPSQNLPPRLKPAAPSKKANQTATVSHTTKVKGAQQQSNNNAQTNHNPKSKSCNII
ncbi:hypothetical protein SNE40_022897 [Patella caerulea]|uniref:Phosphodiesterase n=1 Tax=Patella caerulea TaxID=87958 RepID=A0AAN8G1P9_PATCE